MLKDLRKGDWSRSLRTQIEKYNVLSMADWEEPARLDARFKKLVDGLGLFYSASG